MNAEQDLTALVTKLKAAAGSNLLSVVLYGSAAAGEFHQGHSDLNVLGVMQRLGSKDLAGLHEASAWWVKKGNPAPLFVTADELEHSADVFAIELFDMKAAHRVLHGEHLIARLEVPMEFHRRQVERELRINTLRLRQHYLRHAADSRKTLELMTTSISTFTALFRHALLALGQEAPAAKHDAVNRLGSELGFDPAPFDTVLAIREGKRSARDVDAHATFEAYLNGVCIVTEEVDRRLAKAAAAGS